MQRRVPQFFEREKLRFIISSMLIKMIKMYDSFGLPKLVEVIGDCKEHVFSANTLYSQVVHEEPYGRPWFNIYPLTLLRLKMRVERCSHKVDDLSFITKRFSRYHVHIERNIDLDVIYYDEGKGKPPLVSK